MIGVQLFALLLAAVDAAQAGSVAIGSQLAQQTAQPPSIASPAPVPSPAAPSPPPAAAAPAPPPFSTAPVSTTRGEPRHIDDLSKPLLGAVPQGTYESGVQAAFTRNENLQGPLDGTWVVSEVGGRRLYRLQLNDPGMRGGQVQGAFQDLSVQGMGGSGLLDDVVREGTNLTFNFEARGQPAVLALELKDGAYAGKLTLAGSTREVALARP